MNDLTRRSFLCDMGLGFGSLALSTMLHAEGLGNDPAWSPPDGRPHFAPKAKSVIWLFMVGGVSQMESFDPKPALNQYAGKTVSETPFPNPLESPFLTNVRRERMDVNGQIRTEIFPLQIGWRKHGQSGLEISDWFPHVARHADDLCLVRSMWTEDSNHAAQLQFHQGRHRIDGFFPTVGAWASYGLGALNENLPRFVVLGIPPDDCCGGKESHRAAYLGPQYDGVPLRVDPRDPLPYAKPPAGVYQEEQLAEFQLLNRLNNITSARFPADEAARARIKSYELAFRMQTAAPEAVRFADETQFTQEMYGLNQPETAEFGRQLIVARRLVEQGVRFVQVYHGSTGDGGGWDSHSRLKTLHSAKCRETDQPIGALLTDMKQRGLLDETLVVWATEFGRTSGSQLSNGRDHNPFGFTVWLAGGGIKAGIAHGKTDELGFHAVEHRHYVTDIHATVLHQLGLDSRRLSLPGRVRIEKEYGQVIREIVT